MKQWYRRTLAKVIVLLIGIISGAAFVTSIGGGGHICRHH